MKRIVAIICAASLVFLTSCNGKAGKVFSAVYDVFVKSDDEYIDEAIQSIITAAHENKPEVIEAFFSKTAQKEAPDISEKSKEVANIFKDTVSFAETAGTGKQESKSVDHGKIKKSFKQGTYVYTKEAVYWINFELCIRDDFDENNIGLKYLCVIDLRYHDESYTSTALEDFDYGIRIVGAAE